MVCGYAVIATPGWSAESGLDRVTASGTFRVYFNRHGAEPLMWCISPEAGTWELAVCSVRIITEAVACYHRKETADEDDGRPSAWFSVEGDLDVHNGIATIKRRA